MPIRPMSVNVLVGEQQLAVAHLPARRHLVARIVELGLLVEAEALHVLLHDRLADRDRDLREDGVDRVGERVTRSRSPKLSLESFAAGRPEMTTSLRPLTRDCRLNLPLSIAAVEVTVLNVEPGASPNCVARLTSAPSGSRTRRLYTSVIRPATGCRSGWTPSPAPPPCAGPARRPRRCGRRAPGRRRAGRPDRGSCRGPRRRGGGPAAGRATVRRLLRRSVSGRVVEALEAGAPDGRGSRSRRRGRTARVSGSGGRTCRRAGLEQLRREGEHGAVGGEDPPARDPRLLERCCGCCGCRPAARGRRTRSSAR